MTLEPNRGTDNAQRMKVRKKYSKENGESTKPEIDKRKMLTHTAYLVRHILLIKQMYELFLNYFYHFWRYLLRNINYFLHIFSRNKVLNEICQLVFLSNFVFTVIHAVVDSWFLPYLSPYRHKLLQGYFIFSDIIAHIFFEHFSDIF